MTEQGKEIVEDVLKSYRARQAVQQEISEVLLMPTDETGGDGGTLEEDCHQSDPLDSRWMQMQHLIAFAEYVEQVANAQWVYGQPDNLSHSWYIDHEINAATLKAVVDKIAQIRVDRVLYGDDDYSA